MRTKTALTTVALVGLLLTAGCTTSLSPASVAATSPDDTATDGRAIQIAADGQVQAAPDRAVVRVAATASGDDVDAVRQRLAENATQMFEALRAQGIDESQISTVRYDIGQNYRHEERPSEPKYRGQHTYQITLNDTSRAGPTVVTAVENGASRVEGVSFTLSEEKRDRLREQAISDAVETARGQAETAAESAGLTIVDTETVRTSELRAEPYRIESPTALAAGDAAASPGFAGGSVSVTARVLVTYDAERA